MVKGDCLEPFAGVDPDALAQMQALGTVQWVGHPYYRANLGTVWPFVLQFGLRSLPRLLLADTGQVASFPMAASLGWAIAALSHATRHHPWHALEPGTQQRCIAELGEHACASKMELVRMLSPGRGRPAWIGIPEQPVPGIIVRPFVLHDGALYRPCLLVMRRDVVEFDAQPSHCEAVYAAIQAAKAYPASVNPARGVA